jgi:hypothetical protein
MISKEDRLANLAKAERLVAKVKFWFGSSEPIFDTSKFDVEYDDDKQYATLYRKESV